MQRIINFMNWLTDMDWGWWPLLRLRPQKHEYINARVLLKVTSVFGTVTGVLFIYLTASFGDIEQMLHCIIAGWAIYFAFFRLTFAVAWNLRADSLRKRPEADR